MASRNMMHLAHFLRSRRERIMPEQVGLPAGSRRRTPGLRREEVAVLAGLSPTWYTYLEQGRDIRPSPEVLDSLARVLELTEDERRYIYLLANGQLPPLSTTEYEGVDRKLLQRVVDVVGNVEYPVYVGDVYGDVVAWNPVAASWYTDFGRLPAGRRNMLWWMLTAPEARQRIPDWSEEVRDIVARFRIASATRPWDQRFKELIAAMRKVSPEFRTYWADHEVRDQHNRLRRIRPGDGEVRVVELIVLRMTDAVHSVILHLPVGAAPGDWVDVALVDSALSSDSVK